METMTSLERAQAVLDHEIPDRVPVALHNFLMACEMIGADLRAVLKDGEALAEAQLHSWRQFGHDVIMHENGVCCEAEALGCGVYYQSDLPPHVHDPVIKDWSDIDKLKLPNPETTFPMNEMLKCTRILVRETKGKVFVVGRADQGPMALASALCGPEFFLLSTAEETLRPRIRQLIDFCAKVNCVYGEAHRRAGAHGSSIGAYGSSLISPGMFDDLELPGVKMFTSSMRQVGCRSFVHSCGKEDHLLENLINSEADSLELDPGTDPVICKQTTQGRITVLGMLDAAHVLSRGTSDEARQHTLGILKVMGPGGHYIMGPGCALPRDAPPATIQVVMECARNQGIYAPDGSLPNLKSVCFSASHG